MHTPEHQGDVPPGESRHPDDVLPEGSILGPYEVERFVARGGMAAVYAARDTRTEARVAVKLLRAGSLDTSARGRFRREFRALSRIDHPNVLHVHEWGLHGDRPWFSMELVPGRDLRAEVETWRGLDLQDRFTRVHGVLIQIARALDDLHGRGLVHRDLTPGNIMVRPDGVVKVMDFGVVRELGSELTGVHEVMGTAAWIAPEQILGGAIDARADLYSLGAVLYFLLTGNRPFTARSLQGFLDKHLREQPRSPRAVDPRVPEALDRLCMRLLAKDPDDRLASASHLLHLLGDLDPTDADEHWPPRFVGRHRVRARLQAALTGLATDGRGAAVLLQGPPGHGKTRLLHMAASQARRRGLRVLRAAARPEGGPFGLFVPILRALCPDPDDVPEPLGAALLGRGERPRERYPVLAAFKSLLVANAPMVLVLDDLQDADGASVDLLSYLVRNTLDLDQQPIGFVLAEDADGPEETALQARLAPSPSVQQERIGPLLAAEVEELMVALLPDPERARALALRLHAESEGSPTYLADMLRSLVDEGVLVEHHGRYTLDLGEDEITLSRLPMPASLRQALEERLHPLSPEARQLGCTLAVSRRSIDLDVLLEVAPLDEDMAIEAVDELVEAGIAIEVRREGRERVDLSHRRFREVLLDRIEAEDLRLRHQQLGEVLERIHRSNPALVNEDLTWHFSAAGLTAKAYAYLLRTAQRRLDASLWSEALQFLGRALAMEPEARVHLVLDTADRHLAQIRLGRSQCLAALGRWDEATTEAEQAATLAEAVGDAELESRVRVEVGRQYRQRGALVDAAPWLERALQRATEAHDPALRTTPLYELGALAWARGDLEQAQVRWKATLETAQRVGDERAVGFGHNGLGILAICNGRTLDARRHLEQSARLFGRLGMLAPLSIARINLSELYHSSGLLKKAIRLAERTIEQAREVHHPLGVALGLTHRARVLAELGRSAEAIHDAREAVRLAVQMHAGEDELLTCATLARVQLDAREDSGALATLDSLADLLERFDTEGIAPMVMAWRATALARTGHYEDALAALTLSGSEPPAWPHIRIRTELATAETFQALERPTAARDAFQRALQTAEDNAYRLFQLHAHHGLATVSDTEALRARHARVASALARSLSANLSRSDADGFLARGWGRG